VLLSYWAQSWLLVLRLAPLLLLMRPVLLLLLLAVVGW
jgi:hypothetical protein